MGDDLALAGAPGTGGQQIPHPAAEVGAREQHVGVEGQRQECRQDVGQGRLSHRAPGPACNGESTPHARDCG